MLLKIITHDKQTDKKKKTTNKQTSKQTIVTKKVDPDNMFFSDAALDVIKGSHPVAECQGKTSALIRSSYQFTLE